MDLLHVVRKGKLLVLDLVHLASNLSLAQLLADNPLFILGGANFLGLIEELDVSLLRASVSS